MTEARQEDLELLCRDGVILRGHLWGDGSGSMLGTVIINPATGVLARYYHRYARFLTEHGFRVLTYDYRGIGQSRPPSIRRCGYRWRDWGEQDFDATLRFVEAREWSERIIVVGHSIGGFLPGLSPRSHIIDRMMTVGAQYAYWRDYSDLHRSRLFWKWHIVMPALTFALGYFPGRRLGWLEDLPAGVANEWSFRRRRMEDSYPPAERSAILSRFSSVKAAILAIGISDDEIASPQAIDRTLEYYTSAEKTHVLLTPHDFGEEAIGHFGLFHERHRPGFWTKSINWLVREQNPWPSDTIPPLKSLHEIVPERTIPKVYY